MEEDPERLGLHVDDRLNVPQEDGRILVCFSILKKNILLDNSKVPRCQGTRHSLPTYFSTLSPSLFLSLSPSLSLSDR